VSCVGDGSLMKTSIVTGCLLLALAGRASAQPGLSPPAPALDPEPPPPAQVPAGEPLSENIALGLSLGGTIASWGLVIGAVYAGRDNQGVSSTMATAGSLGIVFAPSFGHWYADKYLTRGLGLRVAGGLVVLAGAVVALAESPLFSESEDSGGSDDPVAGPLIALAGVGLFVAGTVDDIITAPRRVRRLNRERAGFALAPIVTQHGAGLALGGRF
jgi:hypothetical protein